MKPKSDITRYMMKKNILRNILFRVDYKGVVNVSDFISTIKDKLLEPYFNEYNNTFNNNVNIDLSGTSIEDVSKMLSLPVKEVSQQEIHIYSGSKFTNGDMPTTDEVELHVSKYFITLEIKCKGEYKNIDPYLTYFSSLIKNLLSYNNYTRFKRVGLRKIASQLCGNINEVNAIFEPDKYGNILDDKFALVEFNHIDIIRKPEQPYTYNYRRNLKSVQVINKETGVKSDGYLALIDLDSYIIEENINHGDFDVEKSLKEMNNVLFDLFKDAVTDEFLNRNINSDE